MNMYEHEKPEECYGHGQCFEEYEKNKFRKFEDVNCEYNCNLCPCPKCKNLFPKWHFDWCSIHYCYDCNEEYEANGCPEEDEEMAEAEATAKRVKDLIELLEIEWDEDGNLTHDSLILLLCCKQYALQNIELCEMREEDWNVNLEYVDIKEGLNDQG